MLYYILIMKSRINIPSSQKVATLQLAPDEWADGPYTMTCGSAIAESHQLVKLKGKTRWWFYDPACDSPASSIYCSNSLDPNVGGEGFGGRTITLHITDGSTFALKGGWHTNPDSMFEDTGVDIRKLSRTFVVLATGRRHDPNAPSCFRDVYTGVIYRDPDGGLLGYHDRYKELLELFPQATCYFSKSEGGSCGSAIPCTRYPEVALQRCKLFPHHVWSRYTINTVICEECGLQMGHVHGLNVF